MNTEKSKWGEWVSLGAIVAIAPALAYILVYAYEAGFAGYFRFPIELISIETPIIATVTAFLLMFSLVIIVFAIGIVRFLLDIKKPELVRPALRGLWLAFIFCWFLMNDWHAWLGFALFVVFNSLFLLLQRLSGRKDHIEQEAKTASSDFFVSIMPIDNWLFARRLVIAVLNFMVISFLVHSFGRGKAIKQTDFYVIKRSPEVAVMRIYADRLVCAEFDRTAKTLLPKFAVLKSGEGKDIVLNRESIGPLKPQEKLPDSPADKPKEQQSDKAK